jgi:outer membrane protein TolC
MDHADYQGWREEDPAQWQLNDSAALHRQHTLRSRLAPVKDSGEQMNATIASDANVDTYVLVALERNPSIRAAEHRVRQRGARVPQVTSLDDPMFQVTPFGEMPETAAGQVGLMTGVSQKLPFPGKLATRGRIAEQGVAMAMADLQQARLRVAADTRQAYWSYYFSTRAIQITGRSRQLLDQFRQVAEAEYKAGNRSQSDVLRASTELSNLDSELITLEQRQATARSMLNQLMDRPIDAALPEPAAVQFEQLTADLDHLLAAAARHNPAIRKLHEQIEQHRQRQKLARLNRWPDLRISANYNAVDDEGLSMAANGDDQWWFGFAINLPIWVEKYESAEREALQGMLGGVAELTAERNRIAFQIQDAWLKVEAEQKLVKLFAEVIVPQARQTLEASKSGYRAGSLDFLTLMDNWRKLLNFELMQHRALADMQRAAADLEQAIGTQIGRADGRVLPSAEDPAVATSGGGPAEGAGDHLENRP